MNRWLLCSCFFTHHGHFNVMWVHTSPISFVARRKVSLSTFLHATKKIADICMHAGLEDVTNKNCLPNLNVLNVKLMVSLCSTKFNLSTVADKLRIVFETSKTILFLKNWSIRTENYLPLTARCICQLNGKNKRAVQYCRPECSRIPLLSIGKPEV